MAPAQELLSFHFFPSLPKELRLNIWELSVPRERIIDVSLRLHRGRRYELAAAEPRYLGRNALRKPISGERYRASTPGAKLNSKFLRVNGEAREVALGFYRVHIPMYFRGPTRTERTTLYFSPEHDFMRIRAETPVRETLVDFFWDLKAYDPKDIGLLKLAVDLEGFCSHELQYLKPTDLFLIRQQSAVRETLSQLREVWFVYVQPSARGLVAAAEGVFHVAKPRHGCVQAIPFRAGGPMFERLGADPRPWVREELEQFHMGMFDPRELLFRWRRMLRSWGIQHDPNRTDYRLLFSRYPSESDRAERGRETGELHRMMQGLVLEGAGDAGSGASPQSAEQKAGQGEERRAANSFWLFPVEAAGEVGEGEKLADMDFQPCRVLDLSSFWPALGELR